MEVMGKIGKVIFTIVKYLSLVFFSFCAVLPVISCVITAFKTDEEYHTTNVKKKKKNWLYFDNFVRAFKQAGMARAFANSKGLFVFFV